MWSKDTIDELPWRLEWLERNLCFFHPIITYPLCENKVGLKLNWWMTKEPWMTWMFFNSNMWSLCKGEVRSKKCWGITKEPWTTWKRQCFSTNDAITLLRQGGIKILLKDYQRDLKDLNMVNVIKPNDIIILQMWGDVKVMLKNYQGTLNNLKEAYVLPPNYHVTTLWRWGYVKNKLANDWGALKEVNVF